MRSGRRVRFPMNVSMKDAYERSLHVKKVISETTKSRQPCRAFQASCRRTNTYITLVRKYFFTGVKMQRDHSHVKICTTKRYKI